MKKSLGTNLVVLTGILLVGLAFIPNTFAEPVTMNINSYNGPSQPEKNTYSLTEAIDKLNHGEYANDEVTLNIVKTIKGEYLGVLPNLCLRDNVKKLTITSGFDAKLDNPTFENVSFEQDHLNLTFNKVVFAKMNDFRALTSSGDLTIINSTFENIGTGGGLYAGTGAIYCNLGCSSLTITGCHFYDRADSASSSIDICIKRNKTPHIKIEDCYFSAKSLKAGSPAIEITCTGLGEISPSADLTNVIVASCDFNNYCSTFGAIYLMDQNFKISKAPVITRCTFSNNRKAPDGYCSLFGWKSKYNNQTPPYISKAEFIKNNPGDLTSNDPQYLWHTPTSNL